jgi:hypothetical protein
MGAPFRSPPAVTAAYHSTRRLELDHIIDGFFAYANVSPFAYVSPICGIDEQFGSLGFRRRAARNRGLLRTAYFAIPRALKPTVLSRQIEENGRKVLPITLA